MADTSGGWRDPRVRNLRSASVAVLLVLMAFSVATHDTVALGTCSGALVVVLGFGDIARRP